MTIQNFHAKRKQKNSNIDFVIYIKIIIRFFSHCVISQQDKIFLFLFFIVLFETFSHHENIVN